MALKKPTHQLTGEYNVSKMVYPRLPRLTICDDNIDRAGLGSCFAAQKELFHAESRLRECRAKEAEKRKILDQQWNDLFRKEKQLKQNFIKFNKFIENNSDKRDRAKVTLQRKEKLLAEREEEIHALFTESNYLAEIKELMEQRIGFYKITADFLHDVVVKYPGDFENIDDILRKHASLLETQERLIKEQLSDAREIQRVREYFDKQVAEYSVTMTGLATRQGELRRRHEDAKAKSLKWEKLYESIRSQATEKLIESIAIKNSCRLMYEEICARTEIEPVYKDNYGKQFEVIKQALLDYGRINAMVRAAEDETMWLSEKVCLSNRTG